MGERYGRPAARVTTTADGALRARSRPSWRATTSWSLRARDRNGRSVATSFFRWATGRDWVPWSDESQFKMDVIPDKTRYAVGDTATVLFASPFTNAEAWITVEREGMHRAAAAAASPTGRRRSSSRSPRRGRPTRSSRSWWPAAGARAPGPLDDPGRPTIRVGYAELRVTPEVKRLAVTLQPDQAEYRPGDTARVALAVRDSSDGSGVAERGHPLGSGRRRALAHRLPDARPVDLIYRERGSRSAAREQHDRRGAAGAGRR